MLEFRKNTSQAEANWGAYFPWPPKIILIAFFITCSLVTAQAKEAPAINPGCEHETAEQCLNLALEAMGGRERLQQISTVRWHFIGHTMLMEQSYRQAPFITSYERGTTTLDLVSNRMLSEVTLTWPESDDNQAESTTTIVVGPEGGVRRSKDADAPCSLASIDQARDLARFGPLRILLTAAAAPDLHFTTPEVVRSTSHSVLAFTSQGLPIRVLLNRFNHLPDAVETTKEFHDFWFFWGDVSQRIYFDNWKLAQGIEFPTNWIEERNGALWQSRQVLKVELNPAVEEAAFRMDASVARRSAQSAGWNRPFHVDQVKSFAPGIEFFAGPWNSTIVKQEDGIVIVEAPISGVYTKGIVEEAKKRYPGPPIKAVLSTSDSWPHTGGLRYAVSQRFPIYILDLNRPLLERMMQAPHSLDPDELEKQHTAPMWKIVPGKQVLGTGPNRLELYPLRGASTERQYMVYIPEQQLLYASDTLVISEDGKLYDPELMSEVAQAVAREHLNVSRVFAMHQAITPWADVLALIQKAQHS